MEDRAGAAHRGSHGAGVAHVGDLELELAGAVLLAEPLGVPAHARPGEIVEEHDLFAGVEQPPREVRADEAGTAGDEDRSAHSVNPLAASSALASWTRSVTSQPSRQAASSAMPSSNRTAGSNPSSVRARRTSAKQ